MNNKGFTLVEILAVIILLGLIIGIAVPGITRANRKAKEKALASKVENLEKAAILYAQEKNISFDADCNSSGEICESITNCKCSTSAIKVQTLIDNGNIKPDKGNNITNSTDETKKINNCPITIYKKYGKIYAIYTNKTKQTREAVKDTEDVCWVIR